MRSDLNGSKEVEEWSLNKDKLLGGQMSLNTINGGGMSSDYKRKWRDVIYLYLSFDSLVM